MIESISAILASLFRPRHQGGTIIGGKAPARNKPCPCGSGIKYKKCCGAPAPYKPPTFLDKLKRKRRSK